MESTTYQIERQHALCGAVRNMAFDICVQAVKDHTGIPIVIGQNLHYCKHYADMLKIKCVDKVIENMKHDEK